MDRRIDSNRRMWDERVPIHVKSKFYDVDGFRRGRCSLKPFEREEVGDVEGLDLVHLQCHFGLDALSWARRGARVWGVDFSQPAVDVANGLARDLSLDAHFTATDVYHAPSALGGRSFDLVYTGHGALCWLPDIEAWADVVKTLTRPGGRLYLAEFHPLQDIWADEDATVVRSYFQDPAGTRYVEAGTYTDDSDGRTETIENESFEWVHGIGEVVSALVARGFRLHFLRERPITLWQRFPFLVSDAEGIYHTPESHPKVPHTYSLLATRSP